MTITLFLLLFFDVRGIVSDPTGRPVEGAQVTCGAETRTTDAHGGFDFPHACEAVVTKSGFAEKRAALSESGDNPVKLELAPASDRVVVTATGAPVPVEDAGVATDVFTAKDFEPARGAFVQNLLRDVPGLSVVQTGRNGGITSVFTRGGESDSALVLLDGIPLTEPGGGLDFAHLTSPGLERMEVIRGPESVLFGAEASSAVIQMFSERGDPEARRPHGSMAYERGSFSTDHWTAGLNGGFAERLDYAFTADQFRTTSQFPNDAFRITSGTGNLGFRFSDATQLRAVYRTFDSYTGAPGQVAYGLTNFDAIEKDRDAAVSVRLDDRRGARFSQRVLFGYHRYRDTFSDVNNEFYDVSAFVKTDGIKTYFAGRAPVGAPGSVPGDGFVFASSGFTFTDRLSAGYQGTFSQRKGALVFGYDYERQAGLISATDVARDNNGAYVHEQYALTSRIFVTGGVRLEHSSTFGNKFTPRGTVTFRLPAETDFRLSLARGIKEPALIENFARESFYVGNPTLQPEKTDTFEAGLSREWLGKRVRTELSYFRNRFTDRIEFDFSKTPATWENIARSWARGVEFSGSAKVWRFVSAHANYTKLYTHNFGNLTDPEMVRRPRNSGLVSLELTPRRWSLMAGARIVGERPEDDFVFFAINRNQGYENVFVNGSFQVTRHIELHVRVDNALDEQYQEVLGYTALGRNAVGGVKFTW
ncbi:MAG: TonB-dependent receptor [Acidobacteriia bacterium]|nr:TonB-dependent receptor [Terriglobia bacterium]